jgi:RNA polymerase sigma-70 factor, ECF subfamily
MFFTKSMSIDNEGTAAAAAAGSTVHNSLAESEFVERLTAGDPAAFDLLINRYSADIYALLFRLTEDREEAGDLMQETFMSALRSIGSFRGDSELKTWLFRIAINHSRNRHRWWKRRKRNRTVSLDASLGESDLRLIETLESGVADPEAAALRRERELSLRQALAEIPEIFREAVVLCDIEGHSYHEISDLLGVSIGTVKSRIARGREELRTRLKDF